MEELERHGMNKLNKGYLILYQALIFSIESPKLIENMEHSLYYKVSAKFSMNPINVKWIISKQIRGLRKIKTTSPKKFIGEVIQKYYNKF